MNYAYASLQEEPTQPDPSDAPGDGYKTVPPAMQSGISNVTRKAKNTAGPGGQS